jgi:hypothetical protein
MGRKDCPRAIFIRTQIQIMIRKELQTLSYNSVVQRWVTSTFSRHEWFFLTSFYFYKLNIELQEP